MHVTKEKSMYEGQEKKKKQGIAVEEDILLLGTGYVLL